MARKKWYEVQIRFDATQHLADSLREYSIVSGRPASEFIRETLADALVAAGITSAEQFMQERRKMMESS